MTLLSHSWTVGVEGVPPALVLWHLWGLIREQHRNKCHVNAGLTRELGLVSAATGRLLAWAGLLGLKMVL